MTPPLSLSGTAEHATFMVLWMLEHDPAAFERATISFNSKVVTHSDAEQEEYLRLLAERAAGRASS